MAAKKPRKPESDPQPEHGLSPAENREVKEQTNVTSRVVYQTVRTEGEEEVGRPVASLWWSGLAAGIAISSSVFVQGFLEGFLPDTLWRPLVSRFGYCVGFLIVVIARLQLFTENTVTPVLPLLADRTPRSLWLMLRLWAIVFVANLAGTALAALIAVYARFATPEQLATFYVIARPLSEKMPLDILLQAIPAGFFVAAMVWMLAAAKGSHFWIILLMSYLIALGGFPHVVVGSTEVFLLMFSGQLAVWHGTFGIIAPALIGNLVGGTGLFALLAYGQVKEEI